MAPQLTNVLTVRTDVQIQEASIHVLNACKELLQWEGTASVTDVRQGRYLRQQGFLCARNAVSANTV